MIVKIQGGIGNQIFQYAFAKMLSLKHKRIVYLDISEFNTDTFITKRDFRLDIFNISLPLAPEEKLQGFKNFKNNNILNKLRRNFYQYIPFTSNKYLIEKSLKFDKFNIKIFDFYEGYWQSEEYFIEFKSEILSDLIFRNNRVLENNRFYNMIVNSNSVSIHIRRGDYVNNPQVNDYHGSLSIDYYKKAIKLITSKVNNPSFFVFSDDMIWVKENMFKEFKFIFVETITDEEDLFLMSQCKHNVIANSSFSWWAAYMNGYQGKTIISPLSWFSNNKANRDTIDLIPDKWYRI
jgi:hypothetical protein